MVEAAIVCPKCGEESGDDWSQCNLSCPMPMSPHYSKATADRCKKSGAKRKRKQSLLRQIEAVKNKMAANRDEMRELLEDAQAVFDASDEAVENLECAIDRLSEYL
jgi:hypothetical protein